MSKEKSRQLVAIMFTDIVGYTALMQHSEARAAAVRSRHREVFERLHETFRGEILQYFGDGTLSIFQSGVEAVECAIAMQQDLQEGETVPLRIGLHIGDIVFDGTEIYGDSVNQASRIEGMGIAGAVLLSGRVNEELRNHPQISTVSLGHFNLKNILTPVEVFAVSVHGIKVPRPAELKGKQQRAKKSLAVLPFVNMSSDPDNEYFCDGMTEEIINALSRIEGLKITSRTSSFFFKNKNIPVSQIGRELRVSTILEGSIRLSGHKMRITAQLIDVADDFHFWSETFDRPLDDIFAVQDEISLLIADKLREHLGHFDIGEKLVDTPEIPVDTYQNYLRARYHILRMTGPEINLGISLLKQTVEQQPDFALAHLGMHLGYTMLGTIGYIPAEEAFVEGLPFLEKAISLDGNLPESQLHLAYIAFLQEWDFVGAYKHLNRSLAIRPTVEYYQSMASILVAERKFTAALQYLQTAMQLDPFSPINFHLRGFVRYAQEKYTEALELFDRALQLDPHFMASTLYKGQALLLTDRLEEGLAYFQHLDPETSGETLTLGGTTLAYAALGDVQKAEAGMLQLEAARQGSSAERATNLLMLCQAMLGRREQALALIEEAINSRFPMAVYFYVEPIFKPLLTEPRFQELMKQVQGENTSFTLPERKYKRSLLDEASRIKYQEVLEKLMLTEKPYLNPGLTLRALAQKLNLAPNYLSQLLNEGFQQNFSEFVNSYRLKAFKDKVTDPANHQMTILALAYDSGFNSKTAFNTFFKKTMGKTPKAYWQEVTGE